MDLGVSLKFIAIFLALNKFLKLQKYDGFVGMHVFAFGFESCIISLHCWFNVFCYMKRIHFCPFNARSNDVLMWDVVTVVVVYR